MMRCNSFAGAALFTVAAAAAWLPWALVAGPMLGAWHALALYLVAVTALYIGGLSPPRAPRLAGAIVAGVVAAALALGTHSIGELAIALAALLGIARSAFLYRAAPARAVATEIVLLLGGLLFARFLAGPTLISTGLALWGFLLVQACYFLIAGPHPRATTAARADPFDEAHRRALALLERSEA